MLLQRRREQQGLDVDMGTPGWLRLGMPAWARTDWVGKFYPPKTPPTSYLLHYAEACDAIELNATHYNTPDVATQTRWMAQTSDRFRFCPKLPKPVTHEGRLSRNVDDAKRFLDDMLLVRPRMGPVFVQLPPTFGLAALPELAAFFDAWPSDVPVVVEFRAEDIFKRQYLQREVAKLLVRHQVGTVITDTGGRRDVCHGTLTSTTVMVRFAGQGDVNKDLPRLERWVERLLDWRRQGVQDAYFFVHQPDDVIAPETLVAVAPLFQEAGVDLQVPKLREQLALF